MSLFLRKILGAHAAGVPVFVEQAITLNQAS